MANLRKRLTVSFPEPTYDRVMRYAEGRGVSVNSVVNIAVTEWFDAMARKAQAKKAASTTPPVSGGGAGGGSPLRAKPQSLMPKAKGGE